LLHYYHDYGIRPMTDCDVLVHKSDALKAIALLTRLDWHPKHGMSLDEITEVRLDMVHAQSFISPGGQEIDLHWHALLGKQTEFDADFYQQTRVTTLNNTKPVIPCAEILLLHICAHGIKWNWLAPIRWIVDAAILLQQDAANFDWQRVIAIAQQHHLLMQLTKALNYLDANFNVEIPAEILQQLDQIKIPNQDRFCYQLITSRPVSGHQTMLQLLQLFWKIYSKAMAKHNILRKLLVFPQYLKYVWNLDHWWQLPIKVLKSAFKRL